MPFAIRLSRSSSSRSSIVSIDRQGFLIPTPTLAQVVSDSAPDPWTLAAFKAFLSEKFCLETLEFVLDVAAYRKSFDSISACNQTSPLDKDDVESTSLLWQHILRTYIEPQAPREINIPFNIRGYLLGLLDSDSVPPPDAFLPATNMMLELMGGLLFLEFLQHLQHLDAVSTPSPDERSERTRCSGDSGSRSLQACDPKCPALSCLNFQSAKEYSEIPTKPSSPPRVFRLPFMRKRTPHAIGKET